MSRRIYATPDEARAAARRQTHDIIHGLVREGKCAWCRAPHDTGKWYCPDCAVRKSEHVARWRARKRAEARGEAV